MAPASACLNLQFHERRSVFVCESWRRRKFAFVGSIHPQGLPRASYRDSSKDLGKGCGWRKNRTPLGVLGKRPEFPKEFWWRRGELNIRQRQTAGRKMRRNKAFPSAAIPQNHLSDFILGTGCPTLDFRL